MERKHYSGSGYSQKNAYSASRANSAVRSQPSRSGMNSSVRSQSSRSGAARSSGSSQRPGQRPVQQRMAYSGTPSNNNRRPSGQRSYQAQRPVQPRKLQRRKFRIKPAPLILLLVVLALIVYFGITWITVKANQSTFCKNVYINGVDMDKYTYESGVQAIHNMVDTSLDANYTLTWQDRSWTFSARDFNATLDVDSLLDRAWNIGHYGGLLDSKRAISSLKDTPIYLENSVQYDESLINRFIDSIYNEIRIDPVDAEVVMDTDGPHMVSESAEGRSLNREVTLEQICSLIETGEGSTALLVEPVEPAFSSDDANGGLQLIVDFRTDMTFRDWNSRQNVRKALKFFDGICVYPGDTIDFNTIVGPRTANMGWEKGTEFAGNSTKQSYGGGVCQASTTLYNAVMLAGMDILERYPHSMTVVYVDPSLDAAVTDTGSKNMIFKNNTDHAIYICTYVDKEIANVKIYGNRPDYRYELQSTILWQESKCKHVDYIDDVSGKHVLLTTDKPVLYKEGHPALESESYIVAYDWDTGEEVSRTQLSHDRYNSGTSIYWRGIHDPANPSATVMPN